MKDSAQCPERLGTSGGSEEELQAPPRRKFMRGVSAAAAAAALAPLLGSVARPAAPGAPDEDGGRGRSERERGGGRDLDSQHDCLASVGNLGTLLDRRFDG